MKTLELKTSLLLGLFVTSIILANILGTKVTSIFGVRVTVGIYVFPLLFLITDIIAEVHGKGRAQSFVYIGLFCLLFTLLLTYLSIISPPNATWGNQEQYELIFGASMRIMIASVIAFLISQMHDIWAFGMWKKVTKGRFLWLRNNLSTAVSQLIDTCIFMFIAFYKINPKFTAAFVFSLIIPYWLIKVLFALCDTPFVYIGVWWLKRG